MLRTIAFIVLLLACTNGKSAEASYLHYTIDEGLPSNEVYDVYEDARGYIWFATDHGISCYDGYAFRNYSTNEGLVHNTIFGFYEDHRGLVWMRSFNSQLCYMENGVIKPYVHNAKLQAFLGMDFVQRFAFDRAGNLWFVPRSISLGLFFQDARTGEIRQEDLPDGYNAFIRVLDSGELIGGIDKNNGFTDRSVEDDAVLATHNTWHFRIVRAPRPVPREQFCYRQTRPGCFVFSYDCNLVTLENGTITQRRTYNEYVHGMYMDSGGQFWLCMDGFRKCVPGVSEEEPYLGAEFAISMLHDRMGNHWFTTLTDGVYLARDLQVSIMNTAAGLKVNELIDVGCYKNSIVALDAKDRFFHVPLLAQEPQTKRITTLLNPISAAYTLYVAADRNIMYSQNTSFPISEEGLGPAAVKLSVNSGPSSTRDIWREGDSLFCAGNTVWMIFDGENHAVYRSDHNGFTGFCTAIAVDRQHTIWIGTSDGLYWYTGSETVPYKNEDPLFRQRVTDIDFGPAGEMIVSTRGGGLLVVDKDTTYVVRAADGLATDQCGKLCVVDSVVWVCSNNGLTKMVLHRNGNGLTFRFQRFGLQHGLPSEQVNNVVPVGNHLFLATGHGLAWMNTEQFRFNTQAPPVYINTFHVNNHELPLDSVALGWNDHDVTIGFIALLFKSQGLVQYRYMLEGYENEWHYTTERVAHYYNLPAGNYIFIVSAMNENGNWNEAPARKPFMIPLHYTQTAWFLTLIYTAVVLVLVALVLIYLRQQRTKAKAALDLAIAEQRALRAQMKPHFIFNSLNSIQHFIINRDEDAAQLYLTSFAQLMRRVLDHSRTGNITLEEELNTLRLYLDLEKLRFGNNFRFSIEVPHGLNTSSLLLPPLFIQPFVENAIWHGLQMQKNDPVLTVLFEVNGNTLKCVVEDNGIGRKRAAEIRKQHHVSTGLKNVEERVKVLNATSRGKISVSITDLQDAAGNPAGTRVEILFPVVRADED